MYGNDPYPMRDPDVEPDAHRQGSAEWILASTREWMWARLRGTSPPGE